jgi:anti-sigma factor RsiW
MKLNWIQLLAYADGQLPLEDCRDVERVAALSPAIAKAIADFRLSRILYERALTQQSLPPVPESLAKSIATLAHAGWHKDQRH